jgi:hypothetical protein
MDLMHSRIECTGLPCTNGYHARFGNRFNNNRDNNNRDDDDDGEAANRDDGDDDDGDSGRAAKDVPDTRAVDWHRHSPRCDQHPWCCQRTSGAGPAGAQNNSSESSIGGEPKSQGSRNSNGSNPGSIFDDPEMQERTRLLKMAGGDYADPSQTKIEVRISSKVAKEAAWALSNIAAGSFCQCAALAIPVWVPFEKVLDICCGGRIREVEGICVYTSTYQLMPLN